MHVFISFSETSSFTNDSIRVEVKAMQTGSKVKNIGFSENFSHLHPYQKV